MKVLIYFLISINYSFAQVNKKVLFPFISQTYVYNKNDQFIEIINPDYYNSISEGTYFLCIYTNGSDLNKSPTGFVKIPFIAPLGLIVFKNPEANNPIYSLSSLPFSKNFDFDGDKDILILSTSNDAYAYKNRIDIIGNEIDEWGRNTSLVRCSCAMKLPPRNDFFDKNDWVNFTEKEVSIPKSKTNAVLGKHFYETMSFTPFCLWDVQNIHTYINESLPDRSRKVMLNFDYDSGVFGGFEACEIGINYYVVFNIAKNTFVKIKNPLNIRPDAIVNIENPKSLIILNDTK